MTGTDSKSALGAPRNKMALLNEVAAAPSATHAAGQYGEGGNILTQQALTQPGAHAAFRAPFVATPHPGVPPMFAPYGVYGGGAGSLGPGAEWPRWPPAHRVQPPAQLVQLAGAGAGAGGLVAPPAPPPLAVDAKRPWGPRLANEPPQPDPTHGAAGSGSSGGNVLSGGAGGGGGSLGGSLGGGSGASETTFDSYGRAAPPGMALYVHAAAYPGGYPVTGRPAAPWTRQAPVGYPNVPGVSYAPHATIQPPKPPSGFLVEASAAQGSAEEKKEPSGGTAPNGARTNGGGDATTNGAPTRGAEDAAVEPRGSNLAHGSNLVHVQSSAAAVPASAHNPLATRTKSLLGERTFAEVQTMLLRQQGTYERQLLDLHRVVRVQSDIICSITKQDGVDFKSEQDAACRRKKSKSPDSDQSKELKLNKSEQGSGAGSGDGSGQGSGGGSEGGSGDDGSGQGSKGSGPEPGDGSGHGSGGGGGSGQGSGSGGSDVSDGDKGPRRPILKGRRSPRGGGGDANKNKNKRATISPEVDKIERDSSRKDSREEEEERAKKDSRGDGARRARSARAAAAPEAAPRDEAEEGGAQAAPRCAADANVSDPNSANDGKAGPGAADGGPFAAIFSAMAHQTVIKQAARKAFDEQSLQQQRAYALATRPWREEGGGDHRPGDNAAPPSHHQQQHQAAAAVHHAQVQAAYHASRQRSLQSLHHQQQQHEHRYYHDQWVAWYSQQYAHAAAAAATQGACAPGSMGPPQPKPPPGGVAGLGWTNWPHVPVDWFHAGHQQPPRGEEVTQVIGGPSHAHHGAAPGPHGAMAARHHYHFPVPQPPGAMFPHPAYPGSGSQGPNPPALNLGPGGGGGGKSPAAEVNAGVNAGRSTRGGDDDGKSGARDDKKGNNANNNVNNNAKGKRGKGTKRGAGGGRKSADGKTEDIDDAGSDSMMTGQPGQSDGGEVDGHHHGGRGGGGNGGARGNGTNKKGSLIPGAPLTKKPRSGQPKQGPKDQSAADILISIMKA